MLLTLSGTLSMSATRFVILKIQSCISSTSWTRIVVSMTGSVFTSMVTRQLPVSPNSRKFNDANTRTIEAIQNIIFERLEQEGLTKIRLPLGDPDPNMRHVPIFVSKDLEKRSRIVVIFGEPDQALGNLALRVVNGPGGINKGSMVSIVRDINKQSASTTDDSAPGIVLANVGERWWWPEGKRALTQSASTAIPLPSMVHSGRQHDPLINEIAGSETPEKHIEYIFKEVLSHLVNPAAKLDVIGIGSSAEIIEEYLNHDEHWRLWGHRLNTLSILGGFYNRNRLQITGMMEFLAKASPITVESITFLTKSYSAG
jgi:hypothetical protein